MKREGPPGLAEWLLARLVRGSLGADAILGDLAEEHHGLARSRGRLAASAWYGREAAGIASRVVAARAGRPRRGPGPSPFPYPTPGDSLMSELWRDIRLAARLLLHQRGFAFVIVLTLAVGLAANATVMALIDGLILRPFPLRDIDRLAHVYGVDPAGGPFSERATTSPADFTDWQRESRVAETLVAFDWWETTIAGDTEPERVQAFRVSPAFFDALGVGVGAGRGFAAEEGQPGRDRVAVISHGLWSRRYGSDPAVLGRTIELDGIPHVVVGIAPDKFDYPFGSEIWAPLAFAPDALEDRGRRLRLARKTQKAGIARRSRCQPLLDAQLPATSTSYRPSQRTPLVSLWTFLCSRGRRCWRRLLWPNGAVQGKLRATTQEQEFVDQRGRDRPDDWASPVDRLALEDSGRNGRADRPRRVHRRTGERSDREDIGGHRQTDRETANLWRVRVDRGSEHHERQEEGRDHLEPERLAQRHVRGDRLATAARGVEQRRGNRCLERIRCDHGAEDLGHQIDRGHQRLDPSRCEKTDGHRGIEVSRDAHRRRHHHGEDQSVRSRGEDQWGRRRRIATHHDAATADEDQREHSHKLGDEMPKGILHFLAPGYDAGPSLEPRLP